jgi:hypothetical protein
LRNGLVDELHAREPRRVLKFVSSHLGIFAQANC